IAISPDVIFASPHPAVAAVRKQTTTTPIVAVISGDPIRAGFVQSYARPGGNVTAFLFFEAAINTKYLQLLKDIAPNVMRAAVIQSENSAWRGDFAVIETAARSIGVKPVAILVRSAQDIEREMAEFASSPSGGLIFPPDTMTIQHRRLILALAAEHRLPAVYCYPILAGGTLRAGQRLDSEQFRSAPRTCRPLYGRLSVPHCDPRRIHRERAGRKGETGLAFRRRVGRAVFDPDPPGHASVGIVPA